MTRLLQLPEAAREALRSQKISEGHARTILSLKGRPELQSQLLSYILNNNWSVRQAEQFVAGARTGAKASKEEAYYPQEQYVAKQFKQLLNIPVKIRHLGKGGQIIIAYKSPEELQKITKNLEERAEQ